jgi:hypothetical protein
MHTSEALVLKPSYFEVEIATERLERYKLPDIKFWQLNQAGGSTLVQYVLKSTNVNIFGIRKDYHNSGRNLLPLIEMVIKQVIVEPYHCHQLHTQLYPVFLSQG